MSFDRKFIGNFIRTKMKTLTKGRKGWKEWGEGVCGAGIT